MPMTKAEEQMYRQKVIREYQLEQAKNKKHLFHPRVLSILKKMAPLNIIISVIAAFGIIYFRGWEWFISQLLVWVVWVALFSSLFGALLKKQ